MIDAGAEAVIGAHPHRTQGVEYYRGKLIVYSLGNFVFDLTESDDERLGWVLQAELDDRGIRRWATLVVRIDRSGVPIPDAHAETPCGTRMRPTIERCRGGALPEL
jgi:poly-gamma-glutamate synthesis protein (capsule biosynthesis protein)